MKCDEMRLNSLKFDYIRFILIHFDASVPEFNFLNASFSPTRERERAKETNGEREKEMQLNPMKCS